MLEEDQLEDAAPQRRKTVRQGGQAPPTVAVSEPVDRQVANHGHQPGGKARAPHRLLRVTAQPRQIVLAQGLTYPREDVHHVIVVLSVVADGREDEAAIAAKEQVPRDVGMTRLERRDPRFHQATSDARARKPSRVTRCSVRRTVRTELLSPARALTRAVSPAQSARTDRRPGSAASECRRRAIAPLPLCWRGARTPG